MIDLNKVLLGRNLGDFDIMEYDEDEDDEKFLNKIGVKLEDRNGGYITLREYYEDKILELAEYFNKNLYNGAIHEAHLLKEEKAIKDFLEVLIKNRIILLDSYFDVIDWYIETKKEFKEEIEPEVLKYQKNKNYESFSINYGDEHHPKLYVIVNHNDNEILILITHH